jgi:PAT family beta-lactamase induction signal transducer AmpG
MNTAPSRLLVLSLLYVVEGLPFGFQATALGVLLRDRGVSLAHIALAGLLAIPWSLKALWAPLVDRHGSARIGRRKSWILPLQTLLAGLMVAGGLLDPEASLTPLLCLVLAMNFVGATMDIAIDGLAVEILGPAELGLGNAAQVVGYKAGMLLGGGVLLALSAVAAWQTLFFSMAGVVTLAMGVTAWLREPPSAVHEHAAARASVAEVLRTLRATLRAPGAGALLLVIMTYKLGESLIEPIWSPFLRDHGISRELIGLYVGTFGMVASILGSLVGGVLATTVSLPRALTAGAGLRVIALAGQAFIAWQTTPSHLLVAASTCAEHFFSGVLTTVMFALMMSRTDRRIGATHYTLLATLEVLGKAPLSLASGALAELLGVHVSFAIAVGLSLGYFVVLASPQAQGALLASASSAAPSIRIGTQSPSADAPRER